MRLKRLSLLTILLAGAVIGALLLFLCFHTPDRPVLCESAAPPLSDDGEAGTLLQALDRSIAAFGEHAPEALSLQRFFQGQELLNVLLDFRSRLQEWGTGERLFSYVASHYRFFRSCKGDSLVTGYFELDIEGDLARHGPYQYPLYRPPPDLVRPQAAVQVPAPDSEISLTRLRKTPEGDLVPYHTREQIDYEDKLAWKDLEIIWLKSRVDRAYLHIQGSAIITLPDGSKVRVGFADRNGHPYRAIGQYLRERKIFDPKDISMQVIRKYIERHPEEERAILSYNPSYVFFSIRADAAESTPRGSLDVPLTPYRSIAIDPAVFPIGALGFLDGALPTFDAEGNVTGEEPFRGFVLNQDCGAAIKLGRVDLFCGRGPKAELIAGHLRHRGQLWVLAPEKK